MKNIEINSELVLSTSHVTRYECNNSLLKNFSTDEFNVRFLVGPAIEEIEESGSGLSNKNLVRLLKLALVYKCKWLVLDSDGIVCPELPEFNW